MLVYQRVDPFAHHFSTGAWLCMSSLLSVRVRVRGIDGFLPIDTGHELHRWQVGGGCFHEPALNNQF